MTFDQKLAKEGKQRISVCEFVDLPSGLKPIFREKIVPLVSKEAKPLIAKKVKKMPAVVKAPKTGTKQAQVNELVKARINGTGKISKEFKQELIAMIIEKVGMTQAGATTYLYNALRSI